MRPTVAPSQYCEWDEFAQWFADLSTAWQRVLAEPDDAIGLVHARGRTEAGHYRGVLLKLLTEWETEVNETLDDSLNDFAEGGKKAKLTATKKAKAKQPPKPKAAAKAAAASSSGDSSAAAGSSSGKRRRGQ